MMRRTLHRFLIGSALFCLTPNVRSVEPAGSSPLVIDRLIGQLGDKSFRVRQSAGKSLEQYGEEALPALRAATNNTDEEIAQRALVLVQKIERAVLFSPKRVSLSMKDRPIEDVIKELSRQTGYRLQYQGGNIRKFSIEMENATFWEVMDKICNDGHINLGFDDNQGIVYLYQQDTVSPYTYQSGPFHLVAQNFNYSRYVNLANLPRNMGEGNFQNENNLNFSFLVQAEPKVPLLAVTPPKLIKAEDESGISLLARQDEAEQFNVHYYNGNGLYRNFQHSTGVAMAKPAKDATHARIIKGKLMVTVLASTKPDVVVEKVTPGKKKLSANGRSATIEIEEVIEQNKVWTITMSVKRHALNGQPQDFNWINSVPQKLELYDAKDRKFQSQGVTNFIENTVDCVHATYQFSPPATGEIGPAVKLVLAEWVTMSHEIQFEFKNLPLP